MAKTPSRKPSRKLKTYQTSLGFYDQAVAAPSMKAALEAFGAKSNLFHQGIARETDDPAVVAATLAAPGIVLKRPVGSDGAFTEHAGLPTDLAEGEEAAASRSGRNKRAAKAAPKRAAKGAAKGAAKSPRKGAAKTSAKSAVSEREARAAAAAFAKEERRREVARRKEEAARAKERARREKRSAAAEAALESARRDHEARTDAIAAERAALDERAAAEEARWDKQRTKLQEAVRRARD